MRAAALFSSAVLIAACSGLAPIGSASSPPTLATSTPGAGTPAPSDQTIPSPSPSPLVGVRAARGVAAEATVRGTIYLGFEACVGLTPDASSAYLPPAGEDDFVLIFPKGWNVVAAHPVHPRFADHFELRNREGKVVAHDGDDLEVTGEIRATEATYCGFGWPVTARGVKRVGG